MIILHIIAIMTDNDHLMQRSPKVIIMIILPGSCDHFDVDHLMQGGNLIMQGVTPGQEQL